MMMKNIQLYCDDGLVRQESEYVERNVLKWSDDVKIAKKIEQILLLSVDRESLYEWVRDVCN